MSVSLSPPRDALVPASGATANGESERWGAASSPAKKQQRNDVALADASPDADTDASIGDVNEPARLNYELCIFLTLALPQFLEMFCSLGSNAADMIALGHFRNGEMQASLGFALMVLNINLRVFFAFGMGAGALSAQAVGAGMPGMIGIWYQHGVTIAMGLALLSFPLFLFSGQIVQVLVGSDKVLNEAAQDISSYCSIRYVFALIAVPGLCYASGVMTPLKIVYPQSIMASIGFGINALLQCVLGLGMFVPPLAFGWLGSAVGTGISRVVYTWGVIVIGLTCLRSRVKPAWSSGGIKMKHFTKLRFKIYLKQAAPMAISNFVEEMQLQVMSILAGRLGTLQEGAHINVVMVLVITFTWVFGASVACGTRVGHHLGNGNKRKIVFTLRMAGAIMFVSSLLLAAGLIAARRQLASFMTKNTDQQELVGIILVPLGVSLPFVSIFILTVTTLANSGRPLVGSLAFVCGTWCVGIPLSYVFAHLVRFTVPGFLEPDPFHEGNGMGLTGIWMGLILGYIATLFITGTAVLRSDWDKLIDEARERNGAKKVAGRALMERLAADDEEVVGVVVPSPGGSDMYRRGRSEEMPLI